MARTLRIVGYGACMIGGFPFAPGVSFFDRMTNQLKASCRVEESVSSIPGFPINRAEKHLAKRVLSHQPNYVILQFGTSDAVRDLGDYLRSFGKKKKPKSSGLSSPSTLAPISVRSPNPLDLVRWQLKALAVSLLRIPPKTSREVYLASVSVMASAIQAVGADPIVLTPFPLGERSSNQYSRCLAEGVEALGATLAFAVVNPHKLLSHLPARDIWIWNGVHFSEVSHRIVGDELYRVIAEKEQLLDLPHHRAADNRVGP